MAKRPRSLVEREHARRAEAVVDVDRRTAVTHQGTVYVVVRLTDGRMTVFRHSVDGDVVRRPRTRVLTKARRVFALLDVEEVMGE